MPLDVLIVGGGVIGLAAAYRLAGEGLRVRLVDASSGRGASWAAAGMLAPVSEASFGEHELTRLNLAAMPEFTRLVSELEARTGLTAGLSQAGTLVVAFNADDKLAIDRLTSWRAKLGLRSQSLTGSAVRAVEPYLASTVRAGVLAAEDLSVDNRRYLDLLRAGCQQAGVQFEQAMVTRLVSERGRVSGAELDSGEFIAATATVLCSGAASEQLLAIGVQPVKGQILRLAVPDRLRAAGPVLVHTVRGLVRGAEVYLVPRQSGEVVVGATSEQLGHDTTVTAGGIYQLLRDAYELLPISSEFSFIEARAGSRPGTADNGPLLGEYQPGLMIATGHYRNGILLSASTAEAVVALATGRPVAQEWQPFDARRFAGPPR